jgi:hypothetical protein
MHSRNRGEKAGLIIARSCLEIIGPLWRAPLRQCCDREDKRFGDANGGDRTPPSTEKLIFKAALNEGNA